MVFPTQTTRKLPKAIYFFIIIPIPAFIRNHHQMLVSVFRICLGYERKYYTRSIVSSITGLNLKNAISEPFILIAH